MKYLTLLTAFLSFQPATTDINYLVKGIIKGKVENEWIYFLFPTADGKLFGKMDSAKVVNNNFSFSGYVKEPVKVSIGFKNNRNQRMFSGGFFLDSGELTVEIEVGNLENLKAKGTPSQDYYNRFFETYKPIANKENAAYGARLRAVSKRDKKAIQVIDSLFSLCEKEKVALITKEVKTNPNSFVSAYIVNHYLTSMPDEPILQPLYSTLSDNAKNSLYGKLVYKALEGSKRTAVGVQAPYFEIPDGSGKKVSLHFYKGKYILVDFWASWCGPCRAENPNVLEAYQKFREKGFDVLSVSLDDNKTNWLKAVKEDKLPWTHVSDLKGTNSRVKKNYGINAIPMNFLLDKNGKIIAKNLRGTELHKKLAEVLK